MSWRDPKWRYIPAAVHQTSDYLRSKFRRMQREIEAKKKTQAARVTPIRGKERKA